MSFNKLKSISVVTLCCLIMVLCSEIQCEEKVDYIQTTLSDHKRTSETLQQEESPKKQNPVHIGKNKATYVFNNSIPYKEGKFKARSEGKQCYTAPHNPGKFQIQSTEIYAGNPTSMPYEEKLLMRIKKGQDGRVHVQDTTTWPHVIHAQLEMCYARGKNYGGSGILVGPHHILTAAHNIYSNDTKEWAQDISVCLGLNGKAAPFGTLKVVKAHTFKQWVNEHNKNFDIALLVLDRSIGSEIGWSGLLSLDDETLLKEEVHVTGYPGDTGFTKMMTMSHKLKTVEPEQFYYEIDTYGGQSGSGIWIDKWGSPYTIGIHTLGEGMLNTGNSGVRLSHHKFETIIRWLSKSLLLQNNSLDEPLSSAFSQLSISKPSIPQQSSEGCYALGQKNYYGLGVPKDDEEAIKWYRLAATQGYARAQFILGVMYAKGEGVQQDKKEAIKWFTMAANQGHADAQFNLGRIYPYSTRGVRHDKEVIYWYKLAAAQGHADAQFHLGIKYDCGIDIPKDVEEAVKWYKLAAAQGHADAQFHLGIKYACGKDIPKDDEEAIKWYKLAAEQGHADAQFNLGVMYDKGESIPKDVKEAIKWYRLAAEQGHVDAQFNLGIKYDKGEGVPKDIKEAIKWYMLAAKPKDDKESGKWIRGATKQGQARAQFILGIKYDEGKDIPKNDVEAVKWYKLAAEQRHATAQSQYNLGIMYEKGRGVSQGYTEAMKWYWPAAEQGYAPAQFKVGIKYDKGKGVPYDYVEAVKWYKEAAEQGYAPAQFNLGEMYDPEIEHVYGQYVRPDGKEAIYWYKLAAAQGITNRRTLNNFLDNFPKQDLSCQEN